MFYTMLLEKTILNTLWERWTRETGRNAAKYIQLSSRIILNYLFPSLTAVINAGVLYVWKQLSIGLGREVSACVCVWTEKK